MASSSQALLDDEGAADGKTPGRKTIAIAGPPPPLPLLQPQAEPKPPPPPPPPQQQPLPLPRPISMPEYRSISAVSLPPCAPLKPSSQAPGAPAAMASPSPSPSPSPCCSSCGRDGASQTTLHSLPDGGSTKRLCSLCVLARHRGMYCSLCFSVYPHTAAMGDPGLWLTCSKCLRLCHLECARARRIPADSLFFDCSDCLKSSKGSGGGDDSREVGRDASNPSRDPSRSNRGASSDPNRDSLLGSHRDASSFDRDDASSGAKSNDDAAGSNRDASSLNGDGSSLNRDASPGLNGDGSSLNRDASSGLNGDGSSGLNGDASSGSKSSDDAASSNMGSNSRSRPNPSTEGDEGSMNRKRAGELPDVSIAAAAGGGCGTAPAGSNKKPRDSPNPGSEAEECAPSKKPRFCQEASPQEALAAAQIVANIALRQAKEAKDKARALASSSAKASARAKLALDAAHRAAVEEARFRNEMLPRPPSISSSLYPRKGVGPPPYPPSPAPRSDHAHPQAFPRPPPHEGLIAKRLNTSTSTTTTTTTNNNINNNNNNNNNNNGNVSVRPSFTAPYHHPNHPRIKSMPAPPPPPSSVSLSTTHSNMVTRTPGVQKGGTPNKPPVEQNPHAASPSPSLCRAAPSSQQGVLQGQAQVGDPEIGASKVNETDPRATGPSLRLDPSSPRAATPSSRVDASTPAENQRTNSGCLQKDQAHVGDLAVKANENDVSALAPSGASQMHVPRSDAVTSNTADTAMDCSFPATCPVTSAMVTDTLGELKPLSPASGHAVDDFVDMGILLAEECEKIKQNGMGVEANAGVSDRSDSVSVKVDSAKDDQVRETPLNDVLHSGKESIDKESNKYDGKGLAADDDDEKAQCVHDDNAPVATKVH